MKSEEPTSATSSEFLTKREVADILRVSTRTVTNLMRSGVLPFVKIGHIVRFDRASVSEALDAFTVGISANR